MVIRRLLLSAVLALSALPAGAATLYSNFSDMQTANPGLTFTQVSFDSLEGMVAPSFDLGGGLTFTSAGGNLTVIPNLGGSWPSGSILGGQLGGGEIDITLPTTATAFGADFGYYGAFALDVTVTYASGGTGSVVLTPGGSTSPTYQGFVSDAPFTAISFSIPFTFDKLELNSFSFGTPSGGGGSETPEPSTLALMGGALIGLPVLARRRRRQS